MNPINFFLKLFGLKFSDPKIESEYIKTRSPLTKNFLKHLIIVSLFFLIWSVGKAIYNGTRYVPNANPFLLLFCIILLKYYDKYPAFTEVLIVLISCGLYGIGLFAIRIYMSAGYGAVLFYVGYNSSLFQRLIETRFMKASSITLLYAGFFLLRVIIMSEWTFYALLVQLMLETLLMISNIERERQIRRLFKSFFDYRQGLLKFKDLISNHFPENIIIFSKDLTKTLFINDSFQKSFSCKDITETKSFIDTLTIDIETMKGLDLLGDQQMTSSRAKSTNKDMFVVLKSFSEAKEITTSKQIFSFNVRTKYEEKVKAVFQTKLMKLSWDQEEAVAMIFSDLTQQETIMALRLSDSNKDKVIATVSHELRTPINAIIGFAKILEQSGLDKQSQFYVTACKYSANWLLTLVNSILDLSQIRGNCIKICPAYVNLEEVIDEVRKMFSFQCTQKNLVLKFEVARDFPKIVFTDKNRLQQILINLLNNALKFTFSGGITLTAQNDPRDSNNLLFSITDTGIGIKREDFEKLFKMYGRVDQMDRQINTQGVGLGLTISNELVRLLNPRAEMSGIAVQSEFSQGTTFTFSISKNLRPLSQSTRLGTFQSTTEFCDFDDLHALPLPPDKGYKFMPLLSEDNESSSESTTSSNEKNQLQSDTADTTENGPWTLLVDDMPFNLIVATHFLKKKGYNVKTALNGQEAIQVVEDHFKQGKEFRFILMDCQMPVMDGYEATRTLVAMMRNQIIPKMPILAFSANNAQGDIDKATKSGMSGFLFKPFEEEQLLKILSRLGVRY